ncbi:hypothetical protein PCC7424_4104 [Gloeothece citriformis PCC 7424]|uniref:Uncharacterized protein n=1 Tax=Gloeothece citriformis (strain PCC 7424) TaxID=65393 RepID=B7KLA4_GLOC7|nr:hypothetical protein [Gloeothece citriformis]ACK72476.1 hypothetical protein PCC7424_4104 [Gloeothece citriformis PCC 7424]
MNRPSGVIILAILNLVGGFWGIIFNLLAFLFGGLLLTGGVVSGNAQITGGGAVILLTTGVSWLISVLAIALSYGLFMLKNWAWLLTYIIQVINIVINAIRFLLSGSFFESIGALVNVTIACFILFYLNQSKVKNAFGRVS